MSEWDRGLTEDERTTNLLHAAARGPAERGNSLLETHLQGTAPGQPLALAHRRDHRRRPRPAPPRTRPHHMINSDAITGKGSRAGIFSVDKG
jgi:hypothetical protein